MKMNSYSQINNIISDYAAKIVAVENDADLTAEGKQKRIDKLAAERREILNSWAVDLRAAAVKAALTAKDKLGVAQLVREEDAARWDYARLTYESQAIKAACARSGGNIYAVGELWDTIKATGDKYKIKAAIDTLPLEVKSDDMTSDLRAELMQQLAAAVPDTTTDEAREFARVGREHLAELADIRNAARAIDEAIHQRVMGMGADNVTERRVMGGIEADANEIELEFKPLPVDKGKRLEKPEEVLYRLEREREARNAVTLEIAARMGEPMNVDDLD
jgi:hypothetical protein